ncbi:hypothetical protein [Herpetosiphon giganteus]|uniref:hypothetical protein n=1 Tax=Herpetosiphon giganteus TaxID=2029754 RepID=UPI0019565279|nr:hypothetical protein [Herpetosiphon giganteus]MBM7844048.1 hypothetical protein [Herpetosiphon giganteus]
MLAANDSIKSSELNFRSAYRLYGITYLAIVLFLIYTIAQSFEFSGLRVIWIFLSIALPSLVQATALLRISDKGLLIRRGWQRAFIPWNAIESVGIANGKLFTLIPFIVLREPIAKFPKVKLMEVKPEQQHRTITLEGWNKQQQLFEAIYHRVYKNHDSYHVIPEIKKYPKSFMYYDKINFYIIIINLTALLIIGSI